MDIPDFDWSALPFGLRYRLLLGGSGRPHLAGLASLALNTPATVGLGCDLLLAAWEAAPLDGSLAGTLLAVDARARHLDPARRALAGACLAAWREPAEAGRVAALASGRRHAELLALLSAGLRAEPGNLFWRAHLLDLGFFLGDGDALDLGLETPWPAGLGPVREKLLADRAFGQGDFERARAGYSRALALRPARQRMAEALMRLGRQADAAGQWRKALAQAPWNVDVLLRLHDRAAGLDLPGEPLAGRVTLCLYTCGKAREIDATLEALFASDLGDAHVLVLDNGGVGGTPGVLSAWAGRAGQALEVLALPVNVGAPAARNWLAGHEAARAADFVAYLDDDALVPPDWRARMGQAVRAYPDAGVWGCKVVDLAHPGRVQHAEVNLLEAAGDQPEFSALCSQDLDYGQFGRIRPCLSVTGCFHLFRAGTLRQGGGFDIRFSPTQYDDLDHDLRLALRGHGAVCQGHLGVRHARLSGALLNQDAAATGNSAGNLRKLAAKHPPEQLTALRAAVAARIEEDARAKRARLAQA